MSADTTKANRKIKRDARNKLQSSRADADLREIKFNKLIKQFLEIFERLLKGKKAEVYEKDLSFLLEARAENLIESSFWYDGVIDINAEIRKSRQIVFSGKMWTAKDAGNQWLEDFEAIITDKRITKQGVSIKIRVGESTADGNILRT